MLKKSEQKRKNGNHPKKNQIFGVYPQVVLATLSETRIEMFKATGIPFIMEPHKVDEKKIKRAKFCQQKERLATTLAEAKARSIEKDHPNKIIVGSDQILVCEGKLLSKPENVEEAERNLQILAGKNHTLWSSVIAVKTGSIYFSIRKKARIQLKDLSKKEIQNYISVNKNTVLSCVGSYRIEDNEKYGYIKVLSGEEETIKGFPIQEFISILKSK